MEDGERGGMASQDAHASPCHRSTVVGLATLLARHGPLACEFQFAVPVPQNVSHVSLTHISCVGNDHGAANEAHERRAVKNAGLHFLEGGFRAHKELLPQCRVT